MEPAVADRLGQWGAFTCSFPSKRLTLAQDRFFAELESRRKEYEAIATPALMIAGEEDRVVAPKVQRKITTILPNSRFELIPDTGHVVYLERPDVFFGMLREFFARASGSCRSEPSPAERRFKRVLISLPPPATTMA